MSNHSFILYFIPRYDLRKNIDEINNEQAKNSRFMADYITAQEYKVQFWFHFS